MLSLWELWVQFGHGLGLILTLDRNWNYEYDTCTLEGNLVAFQSFHWRLIREPWPVEVDPYRGVTSIHHMQLGVWFLDQLEHLDQPTGNLNLLSKTRNCNIKFNVNDSGVHNPNIMNLTGNGVAYSWRNIWVVSPTENDCELTIVL